MKGEKGRAKSNEFPYVWVFWAKQSKYVVSVRSVEGTSVERARISVHLAALIYKRRKSLWKNTQNELYTVLEF